MDLSVDIDRLILDGLGPVDAAVVGRVVEADLGARLAAVRDVGRAGTAALELVRSPIVVGTGARNPSVLGVGIGAAVAAAVRDGAGDA
jgi:hypothetical protein